MDIYEYVNESVKELGGTPRAEATVRWQFQNLRAEFREEYGRYPTKEEFINYADSHCGTTTMTASAAKAMAMVNSKQKEDNNKEKKTTNNKPFNQNYKLWK